MITSIRSPKKLLLFFFAIVLFGCFFCTQKQASLPPSDKKFEAYFDGEMDAEKAGNKVGVLKRFAVFVDGSQSMKGFANRESSAYNSLIRNIEVPLMAWSQSAERRYFKFGSGVVPLTRKEFLDATHGRFYGMADTNITPAIEKAETAGPDSLSVIVTDFFQSDNDINLLAEKLKHIRECHKWVMGILAVKSDFAGTVFDVGDQGDKFLFDKPSSKRPFYVIVLGQYGHVRKFMEKIGNLTNLKEVNQNNAGFVIFSNKVLDSPPTYSKLKGGNMAKMKSCSVKYPELCKVFQLRAQGDAEPFFVHELSLRYLPSVLQPSLDGSASAKAVRYDEEHNKLIYDPAIASHIKVNVSHKKDTLLLETRVGAHSLPKNVSYLVEVDITPTFTARSYPKWFRDWDMDIKRLPGWRKNPDTFDGSTTYNLYRAMQVLCQISDIETYRVFFIIKTERG
jgi:hypothetical protein